MTCDFRTTSIRCIVNCSGRWRVLGCGDSASADWPNLYCSCCHDASRSVRRSRKAYATIAKSKQLFTIMKLLDTEEELEPTGCQGVLAAGGPVPPPDSHLHQDDCSVSSLTPGFCIVSWPVYQLISTQWNCYFWYQIPDYFAVFGQLSDCRGAAIPSLRHHSWTSWPF